MTGVQTCALPIFFEGLKSTTVSLEHRGTRWGVRMHLEGFPMLAFWTKPNAKAPYLCIEPWHGCGAVEGEGPEFTDKAHCIVLQPGECRTLGYQVELL